jgi:hypothetical protein
MRNVTAKRDLDAIIYNWRQYMNLMNRTLLAAFMAASFSCSVLTVAAASALEGGGQKKEPGRTTLNLNGIWQVECADSEPQAYHHTIRVPGIASTAKPSLPGYSRVNKQKTGDTLKGPVWYKRTFSLERTPGRHAFLFIRAKYNAHVFLNGKDVGYDPHCAYSHGKFDVSKVLNYNGENSLVVKVGGIESASHASRDSKAELWRTSTVPGLWDDVSLMILDTDIWVSHVQMIPDIDSKKVTAKITVENFSDIPEDALVHVRILEKKSGKAVSKRDSTFLAVVGEKENQITIDIPLTSMTLWSGLQWENPFLYECEVMLEQQSSSEIADTRRQIFGMRKFEVESGEDETRRRGFYLNNNRVFLTMGNVCFNRCMSYWPDLFFDEDWIRACLTSLKEHNYNYLFIRLGHGYSKWYELADEVGIMIRDEWKYFHEAEPEPGSQAVKDAEIEMTRWVLQNLNHPSIIVWDRENEGRVRLKDLVAELKTLDPTRPWDFAMGDQHPYRYATGVLPEAIEIAKRPVHIGESIWFWVLPDGSRYFRSKGFNYWNEENPKKGTPEENIQLLNDMVADVGSYYRSRRVDAWAPFTVLGGAEAGGYYLDYKELTPMSVLTTLKHLQEPFNATIDMWQAKDWYKGETQYHPNKEYTKTVYVWNDYPVEKSGTVYCRTYGSDGKTLLFEQKIDVAVAPGEATARDVSFRMPDKPGTCYLVCELKKGEKSIATSIRRRIRVRLPEQEKGSEK